MTQPVPHVADPYRTLGLPRGATDVEIKAAHRKLAKRHHPDAEGGDTRRFLRIQEAYRVLSDPLMRREWDARHAPGPVRADRGERPARAARTRAAKTSAEPAESAPPPPGRSADPRREPRSSRAYTWSATEVPWWEEGTQRDAKRRARRPAAAARDREAADREVPGQDAPAGDTPNEFDVYNRSSGAAWSMAARAYFRRGEQDLPRRGSFHQQGSQPLTAARARTAAEQERRRAASTAVQPEPAVAPRPAPTRPAPDPIVRRPLPAASWPSMPQRLVYALIAWLPLAVAIALSSSARVDEVIQGALMAAALGVMAAVPRLAYVLAVATLGLLIVGAVLIGALFLLGARLPLSTELSAAVGGGLVLGYVATAGMVALGPVGLRPWARQPQTVRNR